MPGQICASIHFCGLELFREYGKNLYTANISTYIYYSAFPFTTFVFPNEEKANSKLTMLILHCMQ